MQADSQHSVPPHPDQEAPSVPEMVIKMGKSNQIWHDFFYHSIGAYCCYFSVAKSCLTFLWTAAYQASLSFIISQSLLKLMSFESIMPSNHLVICHPERAPKTREASEMMK